MTLVENGDKVQLSFEGKLEDGYVFFKNDGEHSIVIIGKHQIFPTLENNIVGMRIGETKTVTLEAKDAFGEHNEELLMSIPKEQLHLDGNTTVGNKIVIDLSEGKKIKGIIVEAASDVVTVDFNHPFAGKKVTVTFTVLSIERYDVQ
jgi:FKBP-type peptidyl-prolyl cis-trans isomerase 2